MRLIMPELPEVETTRRGITPHILHREIIGLELRNTRLRWPVSPLLKEYLIGQRVNNITRRGKYLLFHFDKGTLLIHLGMSGVLRLVPCSMPPTKHDHIDMVFSHIVLRFNDPRRFGAWVWAEGNGLDHPLLKDLGLEPLEAEFTAKSLYKKAQGRNLAIKLFIMDAKTVVGVGNIYANEALFLAGIHPLQPSKTLTLNDFQKLVQAIKQVLRKAIAKGGTTLKDFINSEGKPGHFQLNLKVYGREHQPCVSCQTLIKMIRVGQRSTFFCESCQN